MLQRTAVGFPQAVARSRLLLLSCAVVGGMAGGVYGLVTAAKVPLASTLGECLGLLAGIVATLVHTRGRWTSRHPGHAPSYSQVAVRPERPPPAGDGTSWAALSGRIFDSLGDVRVVAVTDDSPREGQKVRLDLVTRRLATDWVERGRRVCVVEASDDESEWADLLDAGRLGSQLRSLLADTDLVVVSTPALTSATGRRAVAAIGAMIVVRGETMTSGAHLAIAALQERGLRVLGFLPEHFGRPPA